MGIPVELDDDKNLDENGGRWVLEVLALPSTKCFHWVPGRCLEATI